MSGEVWVREEHRYRRGAPAQGECRRRIEVDAGIRPGKLERVALSARLAVLAALQSDRQAELCPALQPLQAGRRNSARLAVRQAGKPLLEG